MPNGPQSWTYDRTKPISYIDDIIHESLRLRPPVSSSGYRVTSSKALQIDEVFIPGDVNVFVPPQLIQTDERYYKFSKQFIPERWGEKKVEWGTDKAPYFPFSLGEFLFLPLLRGRYSSTRCGVCYTRRRYRLLTLELP
ncbi:cytochrome P450 [Aspergillus pseudocaelatus]|uniref:Cytochrome P450 n=1 Tax=Aspergillus pseudocaelatus TaxID=1825620 RepID=A0ABQ6W143_9EURO|nr:cytochrome P450 [Aspergillus pseudocaelatus]